MVQGSGTNNETGRGGLDSAGLTLPMGPKNYPRAVILRDYHYRFKHNVSTKPDGTTFNFTCGDLFLI